jgi:hypothetical protein
MEIFSGFSGAEWAQIELILSSKMCHFWHLEKCYTEAVFVPDLGTDASPENFRD